MQHLAHRRSKCSHGTAVNATGAEVSKCTLLPRKESRFLLLHNMQEIHLATERIKLVLLQQRVGGDSNFPLDRKASYCS